MVQHVAVTFPQNLVTKAEPWSCREKVMTEQSRGAMEKMSRQGEKGAHPVSLI